MRSPFFFPKLLWILFLIISQIAYADENTRPKVALVLSGGGARGFAHIGVLEELDEMQIPVDMVVGTSMGAVVGALYASGYSGKEIRDKLLPLQWGRILKSEPDRDNTYFRRKRDDDIFLIQEVLGFNNGQIQLPRGIWQGQMLYQNFKMLTISNETVHRFDRLPIPFAAVATDLIKGQRVVLKEGDLALAMLGSMSVPGIFPPVEYKDYLLVDGGIMSNVPVEVAKQMGADILIVVNIGTGLTPKNEIINVGSVLEQLTNIYVNENVKISLSLLTKRDVLITPNLAGIDTTDYDDPIKLKQAYERGKQQTIAEENKLKPLVRHHQSRHKQHQDSILVNEVEVKNNTPLGTQTFYDYLPISPGVHRISEINCYINKLYGLELFQNIHYTDEDGTLIVVPKERSWGPTYLQGSFLLSTDFEGGSSFTLTAGLTRTLLNELDGELRGVVTVGEKSSLFAELYQPLSTNLKWYINPQAECQRKSFNVYVDNDDLATYLISRSDLELAFGRVFGEWGRIEGGGITSLIDYRVKIGDPILEEGNFKDSALYGLFQIDTFDDSFFPHKGIRATTTYATHSNHFDQVQIDWNIAQSCGKNNLVLGGFYGSTLRGEPVIDYFFKLGGLFRLSGLAIDQLFGGQAALFHAIYYYEFKTINVLPNYPFPLYLGASLESGNVWDDRNSIFKHSLRGAGSIFFGMDTILGPIYLGYGLAEGGNRAAYLLIGKAF